MVERNKQWLNYHLFPIDNRKTLSSDDVGCNLITFTSDWKLVLKINVCTDLLVVNKVIINIILKLFKTIDFNCKSVLAKAVHTINDQ